MSKFFQALENAERERAASDRDTTPPAATGAATAEPPVAAPPAVGREPAVQPPVADDGPPPVMAEPVAIHVPAYGAARVRATGPVAHERAFERLLPVETAEEAGQLDDHLVSLLDPTGFAAEQYRAVRLQIENLRRERDVHLVAVTSPGRGEGKTLTAINLAGALAQSPDARVVLVEVDLRHPAVHRYLGMPGTRGLSTYLLDPSMPLSAVVERPAGMGFSVVVAGPASSMPYELLKAPRLRALFASLRESFDFVVVDTPPALLFPDVGILRDIVDGFVLVVRANRTPRELVRDSVLALGASRVLGTIFNDHDRDAPVFDQGRERGWRGYLGRPRGGARAA